jgi:hypothetical protein
VPTIWEEEEEEEETKTGVLKKKLRTKIAPPRPPRPPIIHVFNSSATAGVVGVSKNPPGMMMMMIPK